MLTQEQRDEFREQGFIRLRGVFSATAAKSMEDLLWDALGRKHGVSRDDKSTWHIPLGAGLAGLRTHPAFGPIGGPMLQTALDELIGSGRWETPRYWGSLLVSFPQSPGARSRANFHTDFPYSIPATRLIGALVIAFLNSVPPRTGGTLAVAGSHTLVARFLEAKPHLKDLKMKVTRRALLASDPYLRALCCEWTEQDWVAELPMTEHAVSETTLRVMELAGEPGDVIVGHPWLLHSPAPNRGDTPRFMSVQRIRPAIS